jgi:hypothetical protein
MAGTLTRENPEELRKSQRDFAKTSPFPAKRAPVLLSFRFFSPRF